VVYFPKAFGLDYISLNLVSSPLLTSNVFRVFRFGSTWQLLQRALRSPEIDDFNQEKSRSLKYWRSIDDEISPVCDTADVVEQKHGSVALLPDAPDQGNRA
jgi:hypothetical protein